MNPDPRSFFPAARFGEVRDVVPISRGPSGAVVYSVTTVNGDFVLRVQGKERSAWASVVAIHRLAAEHGIAPRLDLVDDAHAVTVSAKIEGMTLAAAMGVPAVRPLALADLVRRIAALHAIPFSGGQEFLPAHAESLWRSQVGRPGFPAWAVSLEGRLMEACSILARDPRRVLSHGDLHPRNVVWDGTRVWLLDWERAGQAHPYSDLATLSNFMNLPEDAALALLAAQEGTAIGVEEQQIFRAARDRSSIVYGVVFMSLAADLAAAPLTNREDTLTLAQCYQRLGAGTLSPNTAEGQVLLGAALFRQATA